MKKKKLIISMSIAFSFIVLFFSCRKVATYLSTIETAENIHSINELPDWLSYLPASAKNISYWKLPLFCTNYEYEVDEIDFLKWAKTNTIPLTEIKDASEIFRYSSHLISYPGREDPNEFSEYESARKAVVHEGYEYHMTFSNGGGSHIVYDSKKHKAYHDFPRR